MHTFITRLMVGASSIFLFVSPLLAETPSDPAGAATLDAWVTQVNHKLEGAMAAPDDASGVVNVTFRRGADGRAADVAVHTANPRLAAAAWATVLRIGRLPALPAGINPREMVQMQLLFDATSDLAAYQAKRKAMFASASLANRDLALRTGNAQVATSR